MTARHISIGLAVLVLVLAGALFWSQYRIASLQEELVYLSAQFDQLSSVAERLALQSKYHEANAQIYQESSEKYGADLVKWMDQAQELMDQKADLRTEVRKLLSQLSELEAAKN